MIEPFYTEQLVSKGIEPMCGWQWLREHWHDLDDWKPTIEISRPGAKYTITARDTKVMNEAIKSVVNK